MILVKLSLAVKKHRDQKQLREERVYSILYFQVMLHHGGKSAQKPKAGTWTWEQKQRQQKLPAYWYAFQGLLSLISYTPHDNLPRGGSSQGGLGLCASIIKMMLYRLIHRTIWWRHFLSGGSFFSDDTSLCQADRKQNKTNNNQDSVMQPLLLEVSNACQKIELLS